MYELKLEYYFKNLEEFEYKKVFNKCIYPWEVLNNINLYMKQFIEDEKIQINKAEIGEFCSITGNYLIGEGTKIQANVTIQGPVIIGKNVEIQSGALIRPGTIIGDNCCIGHCSEIKHSILQNKSKVASLAFVGDSILGKSTRIGSGVVLANRRFDQQNVTVKINNQKISTNRDFFGSIIGDSSRLGANSTAVPGTFIGPYTWIFPMVQVRNFIATEKKVMSIAEYKIVDNEKVELK